MLIDLGGDVNTKDSKKYSALLIASEKGDLEIV
jgi:hypothetical protein